MISIQKRAWSLMNNVLELFAGLGTVALITRVYSPAEAGTWFLFIAIFGIASSLRDALVQSALVKHTSGVRAEERFGFLKANLLSVLGFELLTNLIVLASARAVAGGLGELLMFYSLYSVPNAWFRWQIFYFRSHLWIKEIFIINAVNLVVLIFGCVSVYLFNLPLIHLIMFLGTGSLLGALLFAGKLPYAKILAAKLKTDNFSTIRHYGLFAMLREATSAVSSRISLFYSGTLLTLSQTALLGVSQRFAQITLLPNNAFQSLLFPMLMQAVNEGKTSEARAIFEKSLAQLLAVTIPFAMAGVVLSPYILSFISGAQYSTAWGILATYLLLSTLITPFGTAFGSMVTAIGKPNIAFKVVLVNSILNTALGYWLMQSFGLSGAPMALALTEVFGFFWIGVILKKEAGVSFANTFRQIPGIYVAFFQKSFPEQIRIHFTKPTIKKPI
jgi:O-antigen/teichoic acid export membrane protein